MPGDPLRVLIIGGYGNFGAFIARQLADDAGIRLIVSGRDGARARDLIAGLCAAHPIEWHAFDKSADLAGALAATRPDLVIDTAGPFQGHGYDVAEACIDVGCHYVDLADARAFVCGFAALNERAKAHDVLAISGASSLPALTAAIVDHVAPQFTRIDATDAAIATAQRSRRGGPATTAAILSYVGRPFTTLRDGRWQTVYGWQDLRRETFAGIGRRLLANCDVPDLELFPARYPGLKTVRFQAGLEVPLLQYGLWLLSWLVRGRLLATLQPWAGRLLRASHWFDRLGSADSGFYMRVSGTGHDGAAKHVRFDLTARNGDGVNIPCIPAVVLARKLARGELTARGAYPCVGFVSLEDFLDALRDLNVDQVLTNGR